MQRPAEGGGGGGGGGRKFSFRHLSARLRGEDTSFEAQLDLAVRELREAEDYLEKLQQEFE